MRAGNLLRVCTFKANPRNIERTTFRLLLNTVHCTLYTDYAPVAVAGAQNLIAKRFNMVQYSAVGRSAVLREITYGIYADTAYHYFKVQMVSRGIARASDIAYYLTCGHFRSDSDPRRNSAAVGVSC